MEKKEISKRISIISTEFPPGPGGIGIHAFNVVNELHKLGWEIQVLTNQHYADDKTIARFIAEYHSKIITLEETPSLLSLIKKIIFIYKLIVKFKSSIIISTGKHATIFGYVAKILTGLPFVTIGHGTEFGVVGKKKQWLNRKIYGGSDLLIAVSAFTRNYLESKNINPKKLTVIHNGADHIKYRPLDKDTINAFKVKQHLFNQKIILTVGNVSERKGQINIIKALPLILEHDSSVHYYCIGNPQQKDEFINEAINLNVNNNVHFLGILDDTDVVKWLNCCDVFAMMSSHTEQGDFEGFGIAVIEAALCKTPAIVSSNNSGVIESIDPDITGFGISDKNYPEIARTVLMMLSNEKGLAAMGENAYNRAISFFTWEAQVKKYDDILKIVLEREPLS